MRGKLLMFGFDSLPEILAVQKAVEPLHVEVVPVARGDYRKSLAVLAGLEPADPEAPMYQGAALGGKMMVLCGLEEQLNVLLPALTRAGAGAECLKAVLTAHNRMWNPLTLYAALLRERQTMQGR